MTFALSKRGDRPHGPPEFDQVGNKIICSSGWVGADSNEHERYVVLTIEDGKIVDMQGCRSRRQADRFARRA